MENMHTDVRVQRVDMLLVSRLSTLLRGIPAGNKILCTKIHGRRAINMMRIPCDLSV